MFFDSERNQYIATGGNHLEFLKEKEVSFVIPDGNVLYNNRWHFYFQLLGNLSVPSRHATLVGYIPGSLYFEGKEVPYFTNKFADCALINRTKLENYLKRKVV